MIFKSKSKYLIKNISSQLYLNNKFNNVNIANKTISFYNLGMQLTNKIYYKHSNNLIYNKYFISKSNNCNLNYINNNNNLFNIIKNLTKFNKIHSKLISMENKTFTSKFKNVEENVHFPSMEEDILKYWDDIDAFKQQLENTKDFPVYTFYDGPPFATGLPHYGHITAGTLKDVVTRYWTQNKRYCQRRFGWDCHGLPIECIINEEEGIKSKKDLLDYGINNYNKKCREGVMKYATEWEHYTKRFGRWIDFKNDYKTMDKDFMESVWWVFKKIFDKGLVYRKCKVMPYSWACNTVLSNFEAGQAYKDVSDPSIYVHFPIEDKPNVSFIAWTTTPWTLPSNLALCVNPKFEYVQIKDKEKNKEYIICKDLIEKVAKAIHIKDYETVSTFKGQELKGIAYVPLFETFLKLKNQGCFKIMIDEYVTKEDGTGVVHQAPAFGEDDFRVCFNAGIIDQDNPLCPIDDDGKFTDDFPLVSGLNFKEADEKIIEALKSSGRMLSKGTLNHKYPMCYRTGKPLMYKAIPSWFISVEKIKQDLIDNNKKANWVPKYVQEKRFHNWLKDSKDWCISRSRAWGNPIPIWVSEDFEEKICFSSLKELCEYANLDYNKIDDMHREFLDDIVVPSKKGKGNLKRIPEVFDCWFESGSMPYAQLNYPHKLSEEEFKKRFPADFIAEGLDQTRGWFYTLNVISTILFNSNPYQNLIVNGLVLDKDGKKMSKKDKNYPNPLDMCNKHGADSIRLYLMNSQLVKGQSLKFKEEGLSGVIKDIFLPLYNSYKFLIQNIHRYEMTNNVSFKHNNSILKNSYESLNLTDKWILAYSQRLLKFVRNEMENYRLYTVVTELLSFLEKLTNWYIRLNRNRIKGDNGKEDSELSLNILFKVTLDLIILLSPFIPFLTESIYQNLKVGLEKPENSIHFLYIPKPDETLINNKIESIMKDTITVIEMGRNLREIKKIVIKKPVAEIVIINSNKQFLDNLKQMESYIIDELNTNEIKYANDEDKYLKVSLNPNFEVLYAKSKEIKETMKDENKEDDKDLIQEEKNAKTEANKIASIIKKLNQNKITELVLNGKVQTENKDVPEITKDIVLIKKDFHKNIASDKSYHNLANSECGIRINTTVNEQILNNYYCRDITNKIQKQRKETGIKITDNIIISLNVNENSKTLKKVVKQFKENISKVIKVKLCVGLEEETNYIKHSDVEHNVAEEKIRILIFKKN